MSNQLIGPSYDPDLEADMNSWLLTQGIIADEKAELQKLLQAVRANHLVYAIDLLNQVMNVKGSQLALTGNASRVASDLRAEITHIQKDINDQSTPGGSDPIKMADLLKWVNGLESFLQSQSTSSNPILDNTTEQNMLQSISTIKQQFGNDWGDSTKMADKMKGWVDQISPTAATTDPHNIKQREAISAQLPYWQNMNKPQPPPTSDGTVNSASPTSTPASKPAPPTFSPELNALQNAMQTLNQSTSAFSTVTNTLMQQAAQYYQQIMATLGTIMQGYQDVISASVKRQIAQ